MREWIVTYQKQLSRGIGILLIVVSAGWLFWDMSRSTVSDEEARAAANVARMEARVSGMSTTAPAQKSPDKPYFMDAYKEKQQTQLRYAIIIMMITGLGFFGYSFLKKKE